MKAKSNFQDKAVAGMVMQPPMDVNKLGIQGKFYAEHWRDGVLLHKEEFKNTWMLSALDYLLNVMFHAAAATPTWYVGLFTNASVLTSWQTTANLTEFTGYIGQRKQWQTDPASGQSITNTAVAQFAVNATATVRGAFLCKGSSGAQDLCCASLFATARDVLAGDILNITYTVSAANA